ncbi:MAG: mandelate racemase/muconate lactonizing enzyme family protein [Bacillota bacterium]|nr:mandelate racemase/muconate lactonizing enzyme family protein [Bacillota bacterium]
MRISKVEAAAYRVPVKVPLRSKPMHREAVVARIETDDGLVGYGLTGHILRDGVVAFINREAGPFLVGRDPLPSERVWSDLYRAFNVRTLTGAWSSAVSAIDTALWDIRGKYYGVSTSYLLGGYRTRVGAYITFGLMEYSREELVEVARMLVGEGHDKLKMVVAINGAADPAEDAARVRAVREAIGDRTELMIDANYLFNYPNALRLCKLIEDCNVSWFEEPVYGNDYRLLADLRRNTSVPIAAGQTLGHVWHHRELIANGAVDYSQPNVCYVGGYTEALKVAALARAYNLPIANGGGWPHYNMHLQAAVPNGTRVEFHYLMWKTEDVLFQNTAQPMKGWVDIPQAPGLGMDFSPEAERYLITH